MKLTQLQIDALKELSRFERRFLGGGQFWWRQASMRSLAKLGLVEAWHPAGKTVKNMAHRITEAGRKALEEAE